MIENVVWLKCRNLRNVVDGKQAREKIDSLAKKKKERKFDLPEIHKIAETFSDKTLWNRRAYRILQ